MSNCLFQSTDNACCALGLTPQCLHSWLPHSGLQLTDWEALHQVLKHGPQSSSTGVSWEHIKYSNSWGHIRSTESETLGSGLSNLYLNKPPGDWNEH